MMVCAVTSAGLAMFIAFLIFGSLPLFPYVGFHVSGYHNAGGQFGICCAVTVLSMFLLGAMQVRPWACWLLLCSCSLSPPRLHFPVCVFVCGVVRLQAKFTGANKISSGLWMVFVGVLTAGAAYLVGWGIDTAVNASGSLCL